MSLKTEYQFVCFEKGMTSGPGQIQRWICKARLRGETRLGYAEYNRQFARVIFAWEKTVIDTRHLAEIMDFIKQLEEQEGLIN
jgi:hypothetical protein